MINMLGKKLRSLREKIGYNQAKVGKIIGVSSSTIGMYEQGRRQPDNETLKKLSQLYNVPIDWLLDNEIANDDFEELEMLRTFFINNGIIKEGSKITDEDKNKIITYIKANKKFILSDEPFNE